MTSALSASVRRSVVLDTNLLLLWVVGQVDRELIGRHRRTRMFTQDDYDLLVNMLRRYAGIITTPNVMTEVSNLLAQIGEPNASRCLTQLKCNTRVLDEQYLPSCQLVEEPTFITLGLTDTAIGQLATRGIAVLSVDFPLTQRLATLGLDAVNFNHFRKLG